MGEVLLLEPILEPIPLWMLLPDQSNPGLLVVEGVWGFHVFWAAELNFACWWISRVVFAAKAAHPIRPLVAEEETLVLEEFPETTVDA